MKTVEIRAKVPVELVDQLALIAREARQEGLDLEPRDVLLEALERGIKWLEDLASDEARMLN